MIVITKKYIATQSVSVILPYTITTLARDGYIIKQVYMLLHILF